MTLVSGLLLHPLKLKFLPVAGVVSQGRLQLFYAQGDRRDQGSATTLSEPFCLGWLVLRCIPALSGTIKIEYDQN